MRLSRKKLVLFAAGGLAAMGVVILYFSLPRLVHNALIVQAGKIGLVNLRMRVTRVGWAGLDLADVLAGDDADPALRIRRASVTFSLPDLLRKEIGSVHLTGVLVRIENRGQGFRFPAWAGTAGGGGKAAIGRLDIKDGRLLLRLPDRELEIPFSARAAATGGGYALEADLRPLDTPLRLQGEIDRELGTGTVSFTVPSADLGTLSRQGLPGPAFSARGRLAIQGKLGLRDGKLLGASLSVSSLDELKLVVPEVGEAELATLRLAFGVGSDLLPRDIVASAQGRRLRLGELEAASLFNVEVRGPRWPGIEFSLTNLGVTRPIPFFCERVTGKLVPPLEPALLRGDFRLRSSAGTAAALGLPWALGRSYALAGDFQIARRERQIAWTVKARGNGGLTLVSGRDSLKGVLKLDAALDGDSDRARAAVSFALASVDLRLAALRAGAGAIAGSADLRFGFRGGWSGRGMLRLRDGQATVPGPGGLQAAGISASLPWIRPGAGSGGSGSFTIARLQGNGMQAREISGTLVEDRQGIAFAGLAHTALPAIKVSFQGGVATGADGESWHVDLLVPDAELPAGTLLQALHPSLRGLSGGGRLAARASIRESDGRIEGSASLKIVDGDFDHRGEGIVLRGLQADVRLDSLLELRTPPAQLLRFRELRWQGQAFRNGEFRLQGQGSDRLAIEAGRCEWNGGTVTIDPLTLKLGQADLQVTLRCADVDLVAVLNALAGSAVVSGEARVSGVVPLKLVSGSPLFLGGLLETAPGVGGQLRVSKPEAISGGQVLVEEAIREFNYKWIKVRLDSKDNRLNMVVSIDGAPAGKLPLRYDQKKKDLVRDPSGKRHVELKGLLLDIRFNDIDLKDLIESGGKMTAGHN